jgi:hypothetical protein
VPKKAKRDAKREKRITMEIVVDYYSREEVAMGWYYYLEGQLRFPFTVTCIAPRAVSPLRPGDEVEVIGMPRRRNANARYSSSSVGIGRRDWLCPLPS